MSLELRDLENNLINAETNPLISTHEGFNGSPNEIVFKVVNSGLTDKNCTVSLIGILPQRSEYKIANSSTQLSGQEWSEIESNASLTISISADNEATIRVRIFIPGGTSTQIIDANINVEEVSN